ncbi:neutral/alkaline ceramidase [Sansalvadorimonas sp. 2012CJ34-2]|uniref:Neutral ceramidase n=1 Tax=Parendozoicomonas callyspongiae TaxID=2942213 RepID=A0ABT0PGB0_9GAMM|nr:neutral/alkaline ceramidase [Sansalvadorimonas sp. 2012CJ34-2]MCL6270407.1 neutral/alkaline ceramidase [Sansalvadorimonas sp. 2012CJ34-2]
MRIISATRLWQYFALCLIPLLSSFSFASDIDNYHIGVGKWDISGTAAEIGMMGYADIKQKSSGIHTRQYARAFIVAEPYGKRVVFVNVDAGMVFQSVKQAVTAKLEQLYPGLYSDDNVVLSATHTHSSIGGQSHYTLYNFTIGGHIEQNFDVMVEGIIAAIGQAHNSLAPGRIYISKGELHNASINRSIKAYENNPAEERSRYGSSIDPDMYTLRFMQADKPIGAINWFSVHPTSMSISNTLLSSDHKGYAQYLFENKMAELGHDDFVAAFAQGNNGDVTSNLWLNGSGPTANEFENTRIIGERQFNSAWNLYSTGDIQLEGPIDFRFTYRDYSKQVVDGSYFADGQPRQTCTAALGYSFAAGSTEDASPVDVPWYEGQIEPNLLSKILSTLIFFPTQEDRECQLPKPVLLATGRGIPYPWTPEVLPASILRIGQFAVLAVPGEFTVMSGRRIRNAALNELTGKVEYAAIAGLSNAYAGYVTTPEEYALQHYEGGSTHFGPWTLPAYQQTFATMASAMREGEAITDETQPRDLSGFQLNFTTGVVYDQTPIGKRFGQVVEKDEVKSVYSPGQQVQVRFWTGHPRNDLKTNDTYLEVQRWSGSEWRTVAVDNDWETKYNWKRIDGFWGTSQAIIQWQIPEGTPSGKYRIVHKGNKETIFTGKIKAFTGTSPEFMVQ